ncbi:MAG: 50S ribosomal protein L25 [Candidatus Omnitrophota bacterium]
MATIDLQAKVRSIIGGRHPKRLRKKEIIPAIVYGRGTTATSIQVARGELEHALHTSAGENILIQLKFADDASKDTTVIIKDVQHSIITDQIDHVDFSVISLTEKVRVRVHIHTKGEAEGTKEGGILDVVRREVEVECLPTKIPDRIDVSVEALKINDSIHVKELVFPEGVECLEDPEATVIVVLTPKTEVEAVPTEGEAVEGAEGTVQEPEVIKKGKAEPEGEAAAE